MKPIRVQLPDDMQHLLRDHRGYPVPWIAAVDSKGIPDFRVLDQTKLYRSVNLRLCALCGKEMGEHVYFIGGPLSIQNKVFMDPPMHHDCAVFALKVCPYLAYRGYVGYKVVPELDGVKVEISPHVNTQRPDKFGLGKAWYYGMAELPDGSQAVTCTTWLSMQWWKNGEQVERPESPEEV